MLAAAVALASCAAPAGPRDASGKVTAEATIDTYSLRIGDCTDRLENGSATSFTVIPCDDAHYWEVFAGTVIAGEDFPGTTKVTDQAGDYCEQAFAEFIGKARKDSSYDLTFLQPTASMWDYGYREVLCLAGSSTSTTTGTLADAGR
ncbi:MAG: septum formation family protein [Propionibacteriaceae bacterium]|nr:septum formation family protein [Propionibacteriaceae bacterium]